MVREHGWEISRGKREARKTVTVVDKVEMCATIVKYKKTPCPKCGSTWNRVYGTTLPWRYHLCHGCGTRFRSIEE